MSKWDTSSQNHKLFWSETRFFVVSDNVIVSCSNGFVPLHLVLPISNYSICLHKIINKSLSICLEYGNLKLACHFSHGFYEYTAGWLRCLRWKQRPIPFWTNKIHEKIGRKYLYFNIQQIKTYNILDNICISFIQSLAEIAFDYWKENKLFSSNTSKNMLDDWKKSSF